MELQLPLFPSYVFVHLALRDRLQVLQIPGVVSLVGFNGTPTHLPDIEIETLQASLARRARFEPHAYVRVGRRVRIKNGPLEGLEGIITRKKNRLRLILSLDLIHRSVAVEVEHANIQVL
jgi:transcription antitermination factor NusG